MIYNEENYPEIPTSWTTVSVDDSCVNLSVRNKVQAKNYLPMGSIPIVDQGASLIGGYTNEADFVVTDHLPVVVFGDHTRAVKYIEFPFAAGADGIKALSPHEFYLPKIFYRFIQATLLPDKGYARHFQHLRSSLLPLPPLPEQKRIADKLDPLLARIDACRDRLDQVPKIIKLFRQSVLSAAMSGKLTEDWRDGNFTKAKWETVKFADVGELGRGKSKHRPRNDSRLYGGAYPFIQTGDVAQSDGKITAHSQTYSEFGLAQSKLWPSGTVCITIAANIADTAILTYPACFPDSVVGFAADRKKCLPQFIKWSIDVISERIKSFAPATAQKNINLAILNDIEFQCPSIEEQTEIVRRVEKLFALADSLEARVKTARGKVDSLTPSTLAKAFRGELVPQDSNDEPASELLERIRAKKEAKPAKRKIGR